MSQVSWNGQIRILLYDRGFNHSLKTGYETVVSYPHHAPSWGWMLLICPRPLRCCSKSEKLTISCHDRSLSLLQTAELTVFFVRSSLWTTSVFSRGSAISSGHGHAPMWVFAWIRGDRYPSKMFRTSYAKVCSSRWHMLSFLVDTGRFPLSW